MKVIFLIPVLTLLFTLTVSAKSRVLIDRDAKPSERSVTCVVASDDVLWSGMLAANKELYKQNLIKFDSVILINTIDRKNSCEFLFDLYVKEEHLTRAEIVLSKSDWRKVSRKFIKDNSTAHW